MPLILRVPKIVFGVINAIVIQGPGVGAHSLGSSLDWRELAAVLQQGGGRQILLSPLSLSLSLSLSLTHTQTHTNTPTDPPTRPYI